MFMATLFIRVKRRKEPKCPLTDKWTKKMRHIHTREYYSGIKWKEQLTSTTKWVNLENIMLSEKSQTQKATC